MQTETHRVVDEAPSRPVTTRSLIAFFALTYLVTWTSFVSASRLVAGGGQLPLLLLGSSAPSLVAVVLTARGDGLAGVRELLGRLLRWRVGFAWYAFALGFFAAIKLAAAALYRLGHGTWPPFGHQQWYAVLIAIVLAGIVGGPLGEEIGWRGFALPRLSARFGPALASVVLGLVWACWHLPLFLLSGLSPFADQHGQSFPTYAIQVTAISVALAWLMGKTGGSLLLAVLMHSAINQTKDLVPSRMAGAADVWGPSHSTVAWLTVVLLVLVAAYFVWDMHRTRRNHDRVVPGRAMASAAQPVKPSESAGHLGRTGGQR